MGKLFGIPLRNKRSKLKTAVSTKLRVILLFALSMTLGSCQPVTMSPGCHSHKEPCPVCPNTAGQEADEGEQKAQQTKSLGDTFRTQPPTSTSHLSSLAEIEELNEDIGDSYLIGPGDVLEVHVWNRPEVSDSNLVVGPDGVVSVPRLGNVHLGGYTRDEAEEEMLIYLKQLYEDPEMTLTIRRYNNNSAYVLGRVAQPGIVQFSGPGTLIEAISLAGGIPSAETDVYSTECNIIRGKDKIIWVDLKELLEQGNMTLNTKLQPNDIVYVPPARQYLIYVMGEVDQPRAVPLRTDLTLLDAVMMAGGPTEDTSLSRVYLIRNVAGKSAVKHVDLHHIISTGDHSCNYVLEANDIIYVGQKSIARLNYYLRQLTPSLRFVNLVETTVEALGPDDDDDN